MALKTVSESTKALARKTGKIPAAPKKPKRNAGVTALENYIKRHNAWVDRIAAMAERAKKKEALKKQVFS